MKKLFAVLAIAGVMVACNNSSDTKDTTTDTTKMNSDTMNNMNTGTTDTTTHMSDTTNKMNSKDTMPKK